jgi:hypothetical protein
MTTLLALFAGTALLALRRRRFDLWSLALIGTACLGVVAVQHYLAVTTVHQVVE